MEVPAPGPEAEAWWEKHHVGLGLSTNAAFYLPHNACRALLRKDEPLPDEIHPPSDGKFG